MKNNGKILTPDVLNADLVEDMKKRIPNGTNLANVLMDILSLGKEAVYRRLRGEVPFTLSEAVIISHKLGVSLDKLTGKTLSGDSLFDLNMYESVNYASIYYSFMDNYIALFREFNAASPSEIWDTSNRIPATLYLKYDSLARFHFFKWLYQNDALADNSDSGTYEGLTLPVNIREKHLEINRQVKSFTRSTCIWDLTIFEPFVNDLNYFSSIGLISGESLKEIRSDLLKLVDEIETAAIKGQYEEGGKVLFFISNLNFETAYSCVQSSRQNLSVIKIFDMNTVTSSDDNIYRNLKKWIMSLRKFSSLISQTGEKERFLFFRKQREAIETLPY